MEKNTGVLEVSTCFQGINQLLLTTLFQYILIECLTLKRLCEFFIYRLTIKHWNSNISHPLTARDYASLKMNRHLKGKMPQYYTKVGKLDLTPGSTAGILTKISFEKSNVPHMPGAPPWVKIR